MQAPLAAKSSDAALKTALDGYAAVASAPGDAAKAASTNKAAVEAVGIAEQVLADQFWTTLSRQSFVATLARV